MQKPLHSTTASTLGLLILGIGCCVLSSWLFQWDSALSLSPDWVVMKANTALAFILAGASLYIRGHRSFQNPPGAKKFLWLAQFLAALTILIGLISLLEYLTGFNLGIDQILALEEPGAKGTSHPGRMAPFTCLCLILSGSSLLASDFRNPLLSQSLALFSGLVALLVSVAYIYEAELLANYTRMAFHTSLLFLLLSTGILCLNPEYGLAALFKSGSLGGLMIRRLLPAILFIPLLIGWLRLEGELAGWYGKREGVAFFAFSNIILVGSIAWITARQLHTLDFNRHQAEDKIHQLNRELEQRVAERTSDLEKANNELIQSRSELNSLFESLPGLYLVLTPEFRIVAVSNAYLKATLTKREQILGQNIFTVFPDNPDEPGASGVTNLRDSLNRVLQNKSADTMAIQKYDVRGIDGVFEERYWSPINSPVLDADQRIHYIVHRVEEVTEFVKQKAQSSEKTTGIRFQQMEAEVFQSAQKLQASNRQLEAANRELESFSFSVSHDLRAPLRAITGFTQVLQTSHQEKLDESGRNYLNRVLSAAERMGELIDDLLSLSKLNRSDFNPKDFDISPAVRNICDNLQQSEPSRKVEFLIENNVIVNGDSRLLRIALENLLGNAWKFTSKKDSAVIAFGQTSHPENGNCCYVRDNGAGFNMEFAQKLFGAFQRLHPAKDFPGTGIGLAIVQRIINRHGGRLWAEAKPNEGATFFFTVTDIPLPKPK